MNITIEANKKIVDFLDINFDLSTGIYRPYRKPNTNSSINYLHKDINHSNNSMNEEAFKEAAGAYKAALKENEHNYISKYTPNHTRQENSRANPITEEQNEPELNHTVCQKKKRKKHENKKNNMA